MTNDEAGADEVAWLDPYMVAATKPA